MELGEQWTILGEEVATVGRTQSLMLRRAGDLTVYVWRGLVLETVCWAGGPGRWEDLGGPETSWEASRAAHPWNNQRIGRERGEARRKNVGRREAGSSPAEARIPIRCRCDGRQGALALAGATSARRTTANGCGCGSWCGSWCANRSHSLPSDGVDNGDNGRGDE